MLHKKKAKKQKQKIKKNPQNTKAPVHRVVFALANNDVTVNGKTQSLGDNVALEYFFIFVTTVFVSYLYLLPIQS